MHGVVFQAIKKISNERGFLQEILRNDDSLFADLGQVYVTMTLPGIVKAWYRHDRQIDRMVLVQGSITLALYDSRQDSPSHGAIEAHLISESNPALVQIPAGIWHGFKAVSKEPAILLHLNSAPYDFANPDEEKLDPGDSSIPYSWT